MRDNQGRFVKKDREPQQNEKLEQNEKPERRSKQKANVKKRVEQEYLKALREECSIEEWRIICKKAVDDAKDGDAKARQWLNDYLVGKPQPDAIESETAQSFAKSIVDSVREMSARTDTGSRDDCPTIDKNSLPSKGEG